MKNIQLNKRLSIMALVVAILLVAIVVAGLISNNSMKEIALMRDTSLDIQEATKLGVIDELNRYLGVVDEASWQSARLKAVMTDVCLEKVYHSDFSEFGVANIGSYTITDCQYTLGDTENMDVYVEIATESNRALHFIYTLSNNTIYDVTVF